MGLMSSKFFKHASFYLACSLSIPLFINGCQSIPSDEVVMNQDYWQGMQEKLAGIKTIHLKGSLIFKRGVDRFTANFYYKSQGKDDYNLVLTTPFGKEIANLTVKKRGAQLVTSEGVVEDQNARVLFLNAFDMDLPLENFQDLVIGKAVNDQSLFTEDGSLYQNQFGEFVAQYLKYKSYEHIAIPSEIEVFNQSIKLTIKTNDVVKFEGFDSKAE